ncbi:class I adenylate-forming enzyme family protein [Thalassococcus sp. S3]|uniref:class I adenylate-forming enzyme family protein n=1 Tax=Thalassococcus sp. S3 TaxID=2017482 RepID=UPI0010246E2E|nr:class I adenylate-forming enzyme family protein [Thalassococcus sp. S3]QBF31756.1 benzoate--CoA ligase [Thalassococcus sp. S3]
MLSVFDQGPPAPCPAPFNLAAHVLQHAKAQPDKTALEVISAADAEKWSYARLEAAVRGTAAGLLAQGLTPGDRLILRLGNTIDFPLAYLGAIAAGLVPTPTSSQLTEREVARIFEIVKPAAVLHDPKVATAPHERTIPLKSLQSMRALPPAPYAMGDPNRLAYIIFTSGTSGIPRAVAHAHRAIWARLMMMEGWYGLTAQDRLLHAGAFNWTYTLGTGLMDPWTQGATALIPEAGVDISDLPALLDSHQATIFAAAPGVYRKMLKSGTRFSLPTLRHGLTAGEKLSATLAEAWEGATGTGLYEAYGMSECSTFISSSPAAPVPADALGRPQTGRRVAILGADGPVELGKEGVIAVHRDDPGLMLEYLGAPEETQARMNGDWFLTGDQGVMTKDRRIHYLGRADDMMNAGGYRVSPLEVEAALATCPGVEQIGVTDIEVKEDTRIIAAFYTGPTPLSQDTLAQFADTRLARYKQPRAYIYLDDLPTGANGKLLRRALKDHVKGQLK